jgi:acetyl esterase/lipase
MDCRFMPDLALTRRIVYATDGMDAIRADENIVYRTDDRAELLMDVYHPATSSHGAPAAVVFVHGGPISPEPPAPKDWGVFVSYGQLAASSGLVGVTFNHRLYAPTDYPRSETDLSAAVDFLRAHADELRLDPRRIGLWVFSGGGPLVSWALRERPSYVRCVVAFYALLDLRHLTPSDAIAAHDDGHQATIAVHNRGPGLSVYRVPNSKMWPTSSAGKLSSAPSHAGQPSPEQTARRSTTHA